MSKVTIQTSDKARALRVMQGALGSQSWKHINRSIIANMWLAAAQLYSEEGSYFRSMSCVARAIAVRPFVAGRPVKRLVSHLRFS